MWNILLFIVIYQQCLFSLFCSEKHNNQYAQSLQLHPNEKYLIQHQIDNTTGDLELLHYFYNYQNYQNITLGDEVFPRQLQNYFKVIQVVYFINCTIVLGKNYLGTYNILFQNGSSFRAFDLKEKGPYQNILVKEEKLIVQSISQFNGSEFYQFNVCDLTQCGEIIQFKQKELNEQMLMDTKFLIIVDNSKWEIVIYSHTIDEYQTQFLLFYMLDQQTVYQTFNTRIAKVISAKLLQIDQQESLLILTNQNEIFHFKIVEKVLTLFEKINSDRNVKSYDYLPTNSKLIYIFEQGNKYHLQSYNDIEQTVNIDENTKIIVIQQQKQDKLIFYNKEMIFHLDDTISPIYISSEAKIYQDNNYLFIHQENTITPINLLKLDQASYIQYPKIGHYQIQFKYRAIFNCTLSIEISEQFKHSTEIFKELVVVQSGIMITTKTIEIPGVNFKILEGQNRVLEIPYTLIAYNYKNCYAQDPIHLVPNIFGIDDLSIDLIGYNLFVQYDDGIYELYCSNDKIVSQKPLYLFRNISYDIQQQVQTCVSDEMLLILDEDMLKSFSLKLNNRVHRIIPLYEIRYNMSEDCVLTNNSNKGYKVKDNQILEVTQWELVQFVNKKQMIGSDCIQKLLFQFQQGTILKILHLDLDHILMIYISEGKQFMTKYYIQNCRLIKIFDLNLHNFIIDVPLHIKECQNKIIFSAQLLNQHYLLIYDWTFVYSKCLVFVHKIEPLDKYYCDNNHLVIVNTQITVIKLFTYKLTLKETTDTLFQLKWLIESDYALFEQNEFVQTIIIKPNKLNIFQNNLKIQLNSFTLNNQTLDVNQLFSGPIKNISSSYGIVIPPLNYVKKILIYQGQKSMQCCFKVGNDIYYLIHSGLIKYTEDNEYITFNFDQNIYLNLRKFMYFEKQKLFLIIHYDFKKNRIVCQQVDLQLIHLKTVYLKDCSFNTQIYQCQDLIYIKRNDTIHELYQLKDQDLFYIPIPGNYQSIHYFKHQVVFYVLNGNVLSVLFAEIRNLEVIPIEHKQLLLSVTLQDYNITVTFNKVQLYGEEPIKLLLFTTQGIFIQRLGENISSVILVSQTIQYFVKDDYLIVITPLYSANHVLAEIYDLSQQKSVLTSIQSLYLKSGEFLILDSVSFYNNQMYFILRTPENAIQVYDISPNYLLQINNFTGKINITAYYEDSSQTTTILILLPPIKSYQTYILMVFVTILGIFIEYKRKYVYVKIQ